MLGRIEWYGVRKKEQRGRSRKEKKRVIERYRIKSWKWGVAVCERVRKVN